MWGLAEIKHSLKDGRILEAFCVYMCKLMQTEDQRARPNAQNVEKPSVGSGTVEACPS